MDLKKFKEENAPRKGGGKFQLENPKLLDIEIDGAVMAKIGSMIAYSGDISFEQKSSGGIKGFLKKSVTGEGSIMMKAEGEGHLYLADQAKEVQVLELDEDEEISVNGNDILAFEKNVGWDIKMMKSFGGAAAGGLFNVFLEGPGYIAITTHGDPLVLPTPVRTDPDATVAWSSNVSPDINTDRNLKGFLGRPSGETYQLEFPKEGGFVVVQPFEEVFPEE
ncbi:AIM24 family protein [Halocatena marina]|uniref:AIM24 family protein n=1 Tax=Halocatena marina TaxID=2934937 RepID=UPI002224655A|nr:AIM24 family protein [Halocatena marina]